MHTQDLHPYPHITCKQHHVCPLSPVLCAHSLNGIQVQRGVLDGAREADATLILCEVRDEGGMQ